MYFRYSPWSPTTSTSPQVLLNSQYHITITYPSKSFSVITVNTY